jgi:hypothetical protein
MLSPMRHCLPFLLTLGALLDTAAADALDFSLYPANSQSCLYAAANSSACDHSTVPKFNACVCSNGGDFLQSAASCLGSSDKSDVSPVYVILSSNCADSNTDISFTSNKWNSIAAKAAASATTSKASATVHTTLHTVTASGGQTTEVTSLVTVAPTSSSSTTADQSKESSPSVGTGAIAGIAIGGGALAVIAGLALFFILRRRKANREAQPEAAPFIGPYSGSGNDYNKGHHQLQSFSNLPPSQGSGAEKYGSQPQFGQLQSTSPAPPYGQPQPYGQSGYPPHQPYGGGYAAPSSGIYMPPPQNGAVELAGASAGQNQVHELPSQ